MKDNAAYYFIPEDEVTDAMFENCDIKLGQPLRKSIRPVKGKILCILDYSDKNKVPACMKKYTAYSHKKAREIVHTSDWDFGIEPISLRKRYDFEYIKELFNKELYIQSFGEQYITLFSALKLALLKEHHNYLNSISKWKVFKRRFEKANEEFILNISFFFDLIDENEHDKINQFRDHRNQISHTFEIPIDKEVLLESQADVNMIIDRLLSKLERGIRVPG